MDQIMDMTLFSELGDLLGLDQAFYDEDDAHLVSGSKTDSDREVTPVKKTELPFTGYDQQFTSGYQTYQQSYPDGVTAEIDGLLAEGNSLLNQLVAQAQLPDGEVYVDLADIDELARTMPSPVYDQSPPVYHQMDQAHQTSDFQDMIEDLFKDEPTSPVSTLPSEPASPMELPCFDLGLLPEVAKPHIDDLLKSLVGEDAPLAQLSPEECSSPLSYMSESPVPFSDLDSSITLSAPTYIPESASPVPSDLQTVYSPSPSEDSLDDYTPAPVKKPKSTSRKTPYAKLPPPRKERKMLQNKNAANRYRQKKKEEMSTLTEQEAELLTTNQKLKTEVTNIEREIMCMKELLSEVFNVHSF